MVIISCFINQSNKASNKQENGYKSNHAFGRQYYFELLIINIDSLFAKTVCCWDEACTVCFLQVLLVA
jgi:hypothetical protein